MPGRWKLWCQGARLLAVGSVTGKVIRTGCDDGTSRGDVDETQYSREREREGVDRT